MGNEAEKNSVKNEQFRTEEVIGNIRREPTFEYVIAQEGIEKYIERPCIEACKRLWGLNVMTIESSGNEHGGWIAINNSGLNENNRKRLEESIKSGVAGYSDNISFKRYDGIVVLGADNSEEVSSKLLELTNLFEMQDVGEGAFTKEDFLTFICGCCNITIDEDGHMLRKYNSEKMVKSFEEYLVEKEAIHVSEEDEVYLNEYYFQKHNNYLKYLEETQSIDNPNNS